MHDFTATVREHQGLVRRIARNRSRNGIIDAEDVEQEIWLKLWAEWPKLRDEVDRPVGGLIRYIAQQVATQMWLTATRKKRSGVKVPFEEWQAGTIDGSQMANVQLREAAEVIAALPEKQQIAVAMRAEGYELKEIGAAMGGFSRQYAERLLAAGRRQLEQAGV